MAADPKTPDPSHATALVESIIDQLACPACFGDLRMKENGLVCANCGRGYPAVDGIPVLIAERSGNCEVRKEPVHNRF
jgi:uncharacterized protein YbaR (Trm112 family)